MLGKLLNGTLAPALIWGQTHDTQAFQERPGGFTWTLRSLLQHLPPNS